MAYYVGSSMGERGGPSTAAEAQKNSKKDDEVMAQTLFRTDSR